MSRVHISKDGEPPVQYSESEVQSMFRNGQLNGDALCWKEGMSDWLPLRELFPPPVQSAPAPRSPQPPPISASAASASPYAPPAANPLPAPAPVAGNGYAFTKDPRGLTATLKVMLWVHLGTTVLSLLGDIMQLQLISATVIDPDAAQSNDSRQAMIGLLYSGVYLATTIIFGMWIHRANRNSRGFGAARMQFTPGWAVGYYFIPIMNLFRPFQAMKEIWQVSGDPRRWEVQPGSGLLTLWWTLWIIANVLGQAVFRTSMHAETAEQLQAATAVSIISAIVDIPLALVAIKLVSTILARQVRLVEGQA